VTDPDVTDPEDVTQLRRSDLVEVEIDEAPDDVRPQPLEADPADVADQRRIEHEDDDRQRLDDFEF
jgi:hypothetical protein